MRRLQVAALSPKRFNSKSNIEYRATTQANRSTRSDSSRSEHQHTKSHGENTSKRKRGELMMLPPHPGRRCLSSSYFHSVATFLFTPSSHFRRLVWQLVCIISDSTVILAVYMWKTLRNTLASKLSGCLGKQQSFMLSFMFLPSFTDNRKGKTVCFSEQRHYYCPDLCVNENILLHTHTHTI